MMVPALLLSLGLSIQVPDRLEIHIHFHACGSIQRPASRPAGGDIPRDDASDDPEGSQRPVVPPPQAPTGSRAGVTRERLLRLQAAQDRIADLAVRRIAGSLDRILRSGNPIRRQPGRLAVNRRGLFD